MIRTVFKAPGRDHPVPGLLVDRDGVINKRIVHVIDDRIVDGYVLKPSQLEVLDAVVPLMRRACEAGVPVAIVSNQSCLARRLMDEADLDAIHAHLLDELATRGVTIDALYVCPHHPEAPDEENRQCDCRKPAPGLLLAAAQDLNLDLSRSTFLGDMEWDRQAAEAAGTRFWLVDGETMGAAESKRLAEAVMSELQSE